ncbi:MAG: low affinity iron permease family protein [Pyrinomonadaceae bacterium]
MVLLLLFFLQKSQNHSDKAIHLKLDELVKALGGARDEIAAAEHHADKDMEKDETGELI